MPLQQTSGNATVDAYSSNGVLPVQTYIEDVFSTWLYTGNGSTQTITNGIDVKTKGALVWIKNRTSANDNALFNMPGGGGGYATIAYQSSNSTSGSIFTSPTTSITDATSGFSLSGSSGVLNASSNNYASWTFRKQPKFFDVVTYTGTGAARTIAHNLGSAPRFMLVKRTDTTGNWCAYHSDLGATQIMFLDTTAAAATNTTYWNSTNPNTTVFSVGTNAAVNASGGSYVAYLFASNAGGFGLTGTDNVISCGSFTTDGSGNATVNLGYEPQLVIIKTTGVASNWAIFDIMRGMPASGSDNRLFPNLSAAEDTGFGGIAPTATGFNGLGLSGSGLGASLNYIYIAIRRGPMKVPTDGTTVFSPLVANAVQGTVQTTNFPIDFQLKTLTTGGRDPTVDDRLRGNSSTSTGSGRYLTTDTSSQESTAVATTQAWNNTGFQIPSYYASSETIFWSFRRAPQFSDVVCWTAGSNANARITHNLTTAPQLIFVKQRNVSNNAWACYSASLGIDKYLFLNFSDPSANLSGAWGSSAPTSTDFGIKETAFTTSGATQVAYLFATCPGVSKVGSYTGNGSTQTINCGFTGGARFVLIKCTSATGDWYVYDTARGMTTLTDPYLLLNSTTYSATLGSVTTVTTGFAVNASVLAAINTNAASYIFLAIA